MTKRVELPPVAGSLSQDAKDGLLRWFATEKRDLPWRHTSDPYAVWVSEIMLQQTQVVTVVPYFERWLAKFPTVEALACADEQTVLALWQGLGYYRRCRLLHQGARYVIENGMPRSATEWRKVPGVGDYTAGAISSISLNEPAPLVDGNVCRVYSRIGADRAVGSALERNAWAWARTHISLESPGDWNQALMELGATICTPKQAHCHKCPLAPECQANLRGLVSELPTVKAKMAPMKLHHRTIIPRFENLFGVEQIPEGEWWAGMWRFPKSRSEGAEVDAAYVGRFIHTVTNHRISLEVYVREWKSCSSELRWMEAQDLEEIAMPAPQRRALALHLQAEPRLFG